MNLARLALRLALGRRLPRTSGTIAVDGIEHELVIRRDGHGIPHVEARSDEDAAFAIGFCQGQDRAFQLEVLLRLVRGTLAELVGSAALPIDRLSRRVGFVRGAADQLAASRPELTALVSAFARGVTAGARAGSPRRAHELALLRAEPTPWRVEDVIGVNRLVAFLIPSNWDAELARLKVLTEDGPDALRALDGAAAPGGPGDPGGMLDVLAEELQLFGAVAGAGGASNAWALAGHRTATGRPLLANDPHLAPTLPPHWYLVHVRTPEWELAGASYVGTPAVLTGFNGAGAWGVTAALCDNTDLFVERLDEPGCVVERRLETIRVRGGPTWREEVVVTRNGPVISPALEGIPQAISLRATWLEAKPIAGFLDSFKAQTFEEFRRAFADWPAVPLNVLWADTGGTIGRQVVGAVPRRRLGFGLIPRPGWEPEAAWCADPVPFEELPSRADPPDGVLASANDEPDENEGPFLGADFVDGFRAARIREALGARADWDVSSSALLQLDTVTPVWPELRDAVLGAPVSGADGRRARALLEAWDGDVGAGSAAATVYELLAARLVELLVARCAPRSAAWAAGRGFLTLSPTTLYGRRRAGQLPGRLLEPELVAEGLSGAVRLLRERFGDDERRWAWGRVRPRVYRHPFSSRPPFGRIFDLGPRLGGGDASTIDQAPVDPLDPLGAPSVVPSLRAVIDVGDWEASRFALPGGQSGNPLSPHYDDLLPRFERGDGVPIAWSADSVRRATVATLRLRPRGARPIDKPGQSI